jgi:hypothetical protein
MSYKGHILCRKCKLKLGLGKLLGERSTSGEMADPLGFGMPGLTEEQLGRVVLHFLAQHVRHEVVVAGDPVVEDLADLCEYDSLRMLDDDCPWARSHEPVYVGGVKFYRVPCEPPAERQAREQGGRR